MHIHAHTSSLCHDTDVYKLTDNTLDTLESTILKINRLADDIPLGCIDLIILCSKGLHICVYTLNIHVMKRTIKSILLQGQHCMAPRAIKQ